MMLNGAQPKERIIIIINYIPYTCIYLQDVPTGVPSLVQPNTEKLDVSRLRTDIPKWQQWISANSWQEWEAFLSEGLDMLEEIPASIENEWYINELAEKQIDAVDAEENYVTDRLLQDERQECTVSRNCNNNINFLLKYCMMTVQQSSV